jgi:N-acyl-D-aspartate/D-glutamate deacylase
VAVRYGKIVHVGQVKGTADRTIDAGGKALAPGFIDPHSHSDLPLLVDGNAESKIRQGVTTEVLGENDSVAPRPPGTEAAKQEWSDFNGYFQALQRSGISVNVLSYVGLGTVREVVLGRAQRAPTSAELEKMTGLVADAMKQGAYGVSSGLIYVPNVYASLDELIALAKPAAEAGGLYASHLRYDGNSCAKVSKKQLPSAKAPTFQCTSSISK